jgi:hypothetical protein
MAFFKVRNLSPAFDGLILEGELVYGSVYPSSIINTAVIIGDRVLRIPLPSGSISFSEAYLEPTGDPHREFTTDNPFEAFLYEGNFAKDDLRIAYGMFKNAMQVTIFEVRDNVQKTLFSQNYFENRKMAMELIQAVLEGQMDPDDLIFNLQDLKSGTTLTNGQEKGN